MTAPRLYLNDDVDPLMACILIERSWPPGWAFGR